MHHINSKDLRGSQCHGNKLKKIIKTCHNYSLYNQISLPAGSNPKGKQRNEIWQKDVFHLTEFGRINYIHHTIDTYSGFQRVTALRSVTADYQKQWLLEGIL